MKTNSKVHNWAGMALLAILFLLVSACSKETTEDLSTALNGKSAVNEEIIFDDPESDLALAANPQLLDSSEIYTLIYMREEELLARDVYLAMKAQWNHVVFKNIANSENAHTNAIRKLILKYGLTDPAANHQLGVFVNPGIQALYNTLVAQGSLSLIDAFRVGATIEDLDIFDLQEHIAHDVDNTDILFVLNNLLKGSKAHMRAFYRQLSIRGVIYVPQYITQAELDAILQ